MKPYPTKPYTDWTQQGQGQYNRPFPLLFDDTLTQLGKMNLLMKLFEMLQENFITMQEYMDAVTQFIETEYDKNEEIFGDLKNTVESFENRLENAELTSDEALQIAATLRNKINATAQQLENIVIESGTSDAEVIMARTDSNEDATFNSLPSRLDEQYRFLKNRTDVIKTIINDMTVNVKEFGAIGDGEADDTMAVQAALDFASLTNRYVYVDENTQCKITDNVTIKGERGGFTGGGTLLLAHLDAGIRAASSVKAVNITHITFDGTLYGTYTDHFDEPMGIRAISVYVEKTTVTNCVFKNIYGTGVHVQGVPYVVDNEFYNVAGSNPTADSGGEHDNYGDAVWVGGSQGQSETGYVSHNRMITQHRGRAGVVCEFTTNNVVVSGNYIDGYNQGVHAELCGDVYIEYNFITNCSVAVLASEGIVHVKGNTLRGGTYTPHLYNYGLVYLYTGALGSTITDNDIDITGSVATTAITLTTSNNDGVLIERNKIVGKVVISGNERTVVRHNDITGNVDMVNEVNGVFTYNKLLDTKFTFSTSQNLQIERNEFRHSTGKANVFLVASNIKGGVTIRQNKFYVNTSPLTTYVFESYLGDNTRGNNYFDDNTIYSDAAVKFMQHDAVGNHQPYFVRALNHIITNSNITTVNKFDTKYDMSGRKGVVLYGNAAPTTGIWTQGDKIINTKPSEQGNTGAKYIVASWTCIADGQAGTWVQNRVPTGN